MEHYGKRDHIFDPDIIGSFGIIRWNSMGSCLASYIHNTWLLNMVESQPADYGVVYRSITCSKRCGKDLSSAPVLNDQMTKST